MNKEEKLQSLHYQLSNLYDELAQHNRTIKSEQEYARLTENEIKKLYDEIEAVRISNEEEL